MRAGTREKLASSIVLLLSAALVLWVRLVPLDPARIDADHTYVGADGAEHVYLGDLDGWLWLRHARTLLRTGNACDAVIDGACRDTHTNAPVGARTTYARSLHPAAIAGLHRLLTPWWPDQPLPVTAALLPVVVGVMGVLPAFGIGRMLGGVVAGAFAVVLTMVEPLVLARTIGGDNDIWNVVLPLYTLWFGLLGLRAAGSGGSVTWAIAAGACVGLHAWAWSGWMLFHVVIAAGLVVTALLEVAARRTIRIWESPAGVVLVVFCIASAVATSATPEGGYLALPRAVLEAVLPEHAPAVAPQGAPKPIADLAWPSGLTMVDELGRLDLAAIARLAGGGIVIGAGAVGIVWLWLAGGVGRAAGVILALWLAAGTYAAYGGIRFYLLLVPALGIACAVAVGRVAVLIRGEIGSAGRWYRATATAVLGLVLALAYVRAVEPGWTIARVYQPAMNDAWSEALAHLGETAAPDAIVHTWWDFGHWTTYAADRRVANDGSSLRTHIPYWTSRALLASSEAESTGILRMLSCASDALPLPEGESGAYATVRRTGRDPLAAFQVVNALVERDAAEAGAYLDANGFTPAQREEILRTTHCAPPEAYLITTTRLLEKRSALVEVAGWDPAAPPGAGDGTRVPRAAFEALGASLGTPFLAHWVPCDGTASDGVHTCPIGATIAAGTIRLESFRFDPNAADRSELVTGDDGDSETAGAPALVLIAGAEKIERVVQTAPGQPNFGVLLDVRNPKQARVLVGAPKFLASTLVQLLYLDGRYARRYEKVDERVAAGERITIWKIRWPAAVP